MKEASKNGLDAKPSAADLSAGNGPAQDRVSAGESKRVTACHALAPPACAALLVLLFFPVSGQDDFFITLWPATTLAEAGQILNYNGEPLEQSSALLLTVFLGAFTAIFGGDPAIPARAFSFLCAIACFAVLRPALGLERGEAAWARWFLALSAPFLYWAASGTEMSVMAFLLLLWVAALRSRARRAATAMHFLLVTAAVVANRPEGAFVCFAVLGGLIILDLSSPRRAQQKNLARWSLMTLGVGTCLGALMLWRQLTFGSTWPLPVSAKMGSAQVLDRLQSGFSYLVAWNGLGWLGTPLLMVAALVALRLAFPRRGVELGADSDRLDDGEGLRISALVATAYLGFTVTSGGDWMEAGRFLVPAMPFLAVLAAVGVQELRDLGGAAAKGLGGALLVLSMLSIAAVVVHPKTRALPLWSSGQLAESSFADLPWSERSNKAQLRDVAVLDFLDDLVARAMALDSELGAGTERNLEADSLSVVLASHQMGYVSYRLSRRHHDRLRFIDAAGLVEPSLLECEAIEDRVSHNAGGLWRKGYAYNPYLKVRFLLENVYDCADELPSHRPIDAPIDVLYELGIPDEELLHAYGLTLVYVQDGQFLNRPSFTFVAVRDGLVERLGLDSVRVVKYSSEGDIVSIGQTERSLGEGGNS